MNSSFQFKVWILHNNTKQRNPHILTFRISHSWKSYLALLSTVQHTAGTGAMGSGVAAQNAMVWFLFCFEKKRRGWGGEKNNNWLKWAVAKALSKIHWKPNVDHVFMLNVCRWERVNVFEQWEQLWSLPRSSGHPYGRVYCLWGVWLNTPQASIWGCICTANTHTTHKGTQAFTQ